MAQLPESYSDVRLGAELPTIVNNLERFVKMRAAGHYPSPEIGIAFVAMKRNISDLPQGHQNWKISARQIFLCQQPSTRHRRDASRPLIQPHHPRYRIFAMRRIFRASACPKWTLTNSQKMRSLKFSTAA
jgi:hypothetical protein